jgi:hypothetical protein
MCFSVGVGRNALPWFQPSASGKEIVLRPLTRLLPATSIKVQRLRMVSVVAKQALLGVKVSLYFS